MRLVHWMVSEAWLTLLHVAVIGNTGVGKSSLCNYIGGLRAHSDESFPVSGGPNAFTTQTTAKKVRLLGDGPEIVLVDTPGLNDASGRDSLHIAEMVEQLQQLQYMNSFLITFNSQQPRFDESLTSMIKIFNQIFGREKFFDNVILVFTRYEHDEGAEDKRQLTGETRDKREREFNQKFRDEFGVTRHLPCLFVDAYPNVKNPSEKLANENEILKLKSLTERMKPYPLENLEVVRGYLDQLEDERREEAERADRAEEQAKLRAEEAEEERIRREMDEIKHIEEMETKEKEHRENVDQMEKDMAVERGEHARRQADMERALEAARRQSRRRRRRGWGIRIEL